MNDQNKTDRELIKNILEGLEYLSVKGCIESFSQVNSNINTSKPYIFISFKIFK